MHIPNLTPGVAGPNTPEGIQARDYIVDFINNAGLIGAKAEAVTAPNTTSSIAFATVNAFSGDK